MTKYATLDQLKNELNIDLTDTSRDAYLNDLLDRTSGLVNDLTGRLFGADTVQVTDELHTPRRGFVYLNHTDIADITEVRARINRTYEWTVLAANQFEWWETGRIWLYFLYGYVSVSYTYNAGGTPIPADIVEATLQLATANVNSQNGEGNVASERIGDLQVTYRAPSLTDASESTLATLSRYRVRPL
jgi:hypothetical protein